MQQRVSLLIFLFFLFTKSFTQTPDTWIQRTDFGGTERYGSIGISIGNKGYMGMGFSGVYYKDFWEYDPVNDTWTQKANYGGTARYNPVGFSIGNKGYIGTGNDGSPKSDFWEYDPSMNIWTEKAAFAGGVRWDAVAFNIGNKGYLGTGYDGQVLKMDFWEYDPSINLWIQKANFAGGVRSNASGFSIGNKGYIGTGFNGGLKSDFWEYDPSNNIWTKKANFAGEARYLAIGFSIGNKGYIGTGSSDVNLGTGYDWALRNDFWEYNPVNNTWIQKANYGGGGRIWASGFSIGDNGYIGTGGAGSQGNKKDFWEYNPSLDIINLSPISICSGSEITVIYTTIGTFNLGNIFTVQLSDASGSFSDPISIGTYAAESSDTIIANIPIHTLSGTGYRIRVISSDPIVAGNDNGINIVITSSPSVTNLPATDSICSDNEWTGYTLMSNVLGTTFTWTSFADFGITGNIPSGTGNILAQVFTNSNTTEGTIIFEVIPVYYLCEGNRDTIKIVVNPSPAPSLGNDTSICEGTYIILSPGDGYNSYQWQDNSSSPSINVTTEGYYWVKVKNSKNCETIDSIKVSIVPIPNAFLGNDTSICVNSGIELTPKTSLSTFLWHDGSTSKLYFADKPGIYWVEVSNQCGVDSDSILISSVELMIPNLITPNGDGNNETLQIVGTNNGGNISIYNRWGEKVYENELYENQWKAEGLKDGVYFYEFRYLSCPPEKGWIHIIR